MTGLISSRIQINVSQGTTCRSKTNQLDWQKKAHDGHDVLPFYLHEITIHYAFSFDGEYEIDSVDRL